MNKAAKPKKWIFVDKFTKALKATEYGKPYTAVADLRVVNGKMNIEGMLCIDELDADDWAEMDAEISKRGFTEYHYIRFKNDVEKHVKRTIKKEKLI